MIKNHTTMIKPRKQQKNRKICHIPNKTYKEIRLYGNGDFQLGLKRTNNIIMAINSKDDGIEKIKKALISKDCKILLDHLMELYPVHYRSLMNLDKFVEYFLVTDKLDYVILKQGHEDKSIDEFQKKQGKVKGV